MSSTREDLIAQVMAAGRESSGAGVLLHALVAERLGPNPTDTKTFDLLLREGPMAPGEISRATGLTSASVTALIDRLERRGLVERLRDSPDRRRVTVRPRPEALAAFGELLSPFLQRLQASLASYSDAELQAIARYLSETAAIAREEAVRLGDGQ